MEFPRPNWRVFRQKRVWIPTVVGIVIIALIIVGFIYRSSVKSYIDRRIAAAVSGAGASVAIDQVLQDPEVAKYVDSRIEAKLKDLVPSEGLSKAEVETIVNEAIATIDTAGLTDAEITEKIKAAVEARLKTLVANEDLQKILDVAVAAVIDAKINPVQELAKAASDAASKAQTDVTELTSRVAALEAKPPAPTEPTKPTEPPVVTKPAEEEDVDAAWQKALAEMRKATGTAE